ncbi:protein of unknown function (DUF4360) domain containing protein [Hyaloscypha variabilis]|uniref:Secreted protein n=1 Tax=Hyaloscypha variabilis (strain UAMH 11265 / GT02V1 / F) TaxID=1149755 RepID=A0A2J6S9N8_HYAVF|nr:hypothetical protein L207DRAFT_576259 [Hyaloscypha variabilis F]
MLAILSIAAFAIAALATPIPDEPALLLASDPPGLNKSQVYIVDITYGGTGCPQNSVGKFVSSDAETFTLIFDDMVAEVGDGTKPSDSRKNCQINLLLNYPQGFTYTVLNTQFRGYADIPAGYTGVQQATYYFSGLAQQATSTLEFDGPVTGDYHTDKDVDLLSVVWAPCGQVLPVNINSQVRVTKNAGAASGEGQLTQDSADGKVTWVAGISWKSC